MVTGGRRRAGEAIIEAYYRARRRARSPVATGLAVALGVFIGCLPLYGLHLLLCFGTARLLRVSGVLAYLAAHVNNPWTAPLILYLEVGIGHLICEREWIRLSPAALADAGGLALGRDLAVGALALGAGLAVPLGLGALVLARRARATPALVRLVDDVSRRYAAHGIRTWESVRAKLRYDPAYAAILGTAELSAGGRLLDLGCGRGILLAAFCSRPETDSTPRPRLTGIEVDRRAAETARQALGDDAVVEIADLRSVALPASDVVVCLDVLHYLSADEQDDLVARVAASLAPSGLFLVREAALGLGARSAATRVQERLAAWSRGEWGRSFFYRDEAGWRELLARRGFRAVSQPLWRGTPFSNVLVRGEVGRPGDSGGAGGDRGGAGRRRAREVEAPVGDPVPEVLGLEPEPES